MEIETYYGHISYHLFKDEQFVSLFIVNNKYRGKGYGKKLAELLPSRCWLLCQPLYNLNSKTILNLEQLKRFYRGVGFRIYRGPDTQYYAFKGFRPSKGFWNRLSTV